MTILALDMSKSRTGWAFWRPGMNCNAPFGHWVLGGEYSSEGMTYGKVHERLSEMHMVEKITRIYMEQPIHPASLTGHTNIDTLRVLAGVCAHVHSFAAAMRLPVPVEINVSSWRRGFIGPQKRGTKSKTLKDLTMERCRQLGFAPKYDDQADAIGILTYALDHHEHVTPPWLSSERLGLGDMK
jgi:hypothetical protein